MTLSDHLASHPVTTLLVLTAIGCVILTLFAMAFETLEPVEACAVMRCRAL